MNFISVPNKIRYTMAAIVRLISLLFITSTLSFCKVSKQPFYSYKTATYSTDSVKRLLYYNHLISYGDYLFEFKITTRITTDIGESQSVSETFDYDTTGVYLLSGIDGFFYEFDTFALENSILKKGKLQDKPSGQNFSFQSNGKSLDVTFDIPQPVEVNNIPCFFTRSVENNKTGGDSIDQKILLIKNPKFNSLYKINGITFTDSNYCIVGFQILNLERKQGLLEEIASIRNLNEDERMICESMIRKVRANPSIL